MYKKVFIKRAVLSMLVLIPLLSLASCKKKYEVDYIKADDSIYYESDDTKHNTIELNGHVAKIYKNETFSIYYQETTNEVYYENQYLESLIPCNEATKGQTKLYYSKTATENKIVLTVESPANCKMFLTKNDDSVTQVAEAYAFTITMDLSVEIPTYTYTSYWNQFKDYSPSKMYDSVANQPIEKNVIINYESELIETMNDFKNHIAEVKVEKESRTDNVSFKNYNKGLFYATIVGSIVLVLAIVVFTTFALLMHFPKNKENK